MSRVSMYLLSLAATGAVLASSAYGQAVISTHSGLVHFFEGAVTISGQPLESRFGKFTSIPEGGELRTAQGRAEILLTPGVFLRVGENSAIRMVSTSLADTKVELLAGSAIMESSEPSDGTAVTLIYKNWTIRQPHEGSYRVDCDPPRVRVRGGNVTIAAAGDAAVSVDQGNDLPLQAVLAPEKAAADPPDSLSNWSEGRSQSISADNAISADIQDPANMNGTYAPVDAFTYFPLLGYPSMSTTAGTYGAATPYESPIYGTGVIQPGFYSLYLPGYTYRPSMLGLTPLGLGRSLYPVRIGTGIGSGLGTGLGAYPGRTGFGYGSRTGTGAVPRPPAVRPVGPPVMSHPMPPAARPIGHIGGHR